jgi:hypothetical protein
VLRQRIVEFRVPHHVEDRREGLMHDGPGLRRHLDDRGRGVMRVGKLLLEGAAATRDLATFVACRIQGALHAFERGGVDERTHQRATLAGIADREPGVGRLERGDERIIDRLMNE